MRLNWHSRRKVNDCHAIAGNPGFLDVRGTNYIGAEVRAAGTASYPQKSRCKSQRKNVTRAWETESTTSIEGKVIIQICIAR